MARKRKPPPQVIMICVVNGKPRILTADDGEPHCFKNMDEAMEFTCQLHMLVNAAETILIVDCETSEIDTF